MQKKLDWLKILPVVKNLQFLSDQAEIQAILPTHELFILTKFDADWSKNVDFFIRSISFGQYDFILISL